MEKTKRISWKAVFQITKSEYRRMITDPRNIVVLSMYLVFYEMILKMFFQMSEKMGKPIQILEPFLAICSADSVMIMFPIVFLVLINDFPRTEDNFRFYIIRAGKKNWIIGQAVYAFLTSLTYSAVTLAVTCALALPHAYGENIWSDVSTKYYLMFPEEINSMANNLINSRLYNQTTPMEASIHTFCLYSLYLFLLAMLCFLAFMFCHRTGGILMAGLIIVIGGILAFCNLAGEWYMPTSHAVVWKHFDLILRKMIYPLNWSYLYFIALIAVSLILIFIKSRHRNFDTI